MIESPFMTYAEVCKLVKRALTTVKRMVEDGELPPTVPNPKRPMFVRAQVEEYIARRSNGHTPGEVPVKPPGVEKRGPGRPRKEPKTRRRAS
jgi:excisionase family DNA binding protein